MRRADYIQAQQILARDLPALNLWYRHSRGSQPPPCQPAPTPSGSYTFLETAELTQQAK